MPFRKAWLYVLTLLVLTFVAFWPSYLSKLPAAKMAHHFHAASAVLWTVLAIVQSWTIHHDRISLHRRTGDGDFPAVPPVPGCGRLGDSCRGDHPCETGLDSATGLSNSENVELAQFGFFDPLANLGYALMFWGGLKYRYKVHLHARYMLGTIMFVIAPIVWRLLRGYAQDPRTVHSLTPSRSAISPRLESPCFFTRRRRSAGRPFLLVAGIIAAPGGSLETLRYQPGHQCLPASPI